MRVFRLHILLTVFLAAMMLSCEDDFLPQDQDVIIVEGWIDEGGFPVVIVTRSLPVRFRDDAVQLEDLSDYVVKLARVTVSDGVNSVILTGHRDTSPDMSTRRVTFAVRPVRPIHSLSVPAPGQ